jgi:hypothetical protein
LNQQLGELGDPSGNANQPGQPQPGEPEPPIEPGRAKAAITALTGALKKGLNALGDKFTKMQFERPGSSKLVDGIGPCPQADWQPCFKVTDDEVIGILDRVQDESIHKPIGKPNKQYVPPPSNTNTQTGGRKRKKRRIVRFKHKHKRGGAGTPPPRQQTQEEINKQAMDNWEAGTEDVSQTTRFLSDYESTLHELVDPAFVQSLATMPVANLSPGQRGDLVRSYKKLGGVTARIVRNPSFQLIRTGLTESPLDKVFTKLSQDLSTASNIIRDTPAAVAVPAGIGNPALFIGSALTKLQNAIDGGNQVLEQLSLLKSARAKEREKAAAAVAYLARLFTQGMEDNVKVIRDHLRKHGGDDGIELSTAINNLAKYLRETVRPVRMLQPSNQRQSRNPLGTSSTVSSGQNSTGRSRMAYYDQSQLPTVQTLPRRQGPL